MLYTLIFSSDAGYTFALASFSSSANSTPAISSVIFHSCKFQSPTHRRNLLQRQLQQRLHIRIVVILYCDQLHNTLEAVTVPMSTTSAARGCTSQGGEKNLGPNLQGKVVSTPQAENAPRSRARVHFLGNWGNLGGGEVI